MGQIQQLNAEFSSVEEISVAVGQTGYYADFRQLKRGPGPVSLDVVQSPKSLMMQVGLASRVHQQALTPPDTVTFALLTDAQVPVKFGPREMDARAITCVDPAVGLDCVSAAGFSAYTLSFAVGRITEIARSLGVDDPSQCHDRLGQHHRVDPFALSRIRNLLSVFFSELETCDAQARSNALSAIESDLPQALLLAWGSGVQETTVSRTNRSRALTRALDYIESHPRDKVISVEELCAYSACSVSTLERTFRDYFSASPKQYLTIRRLSGVRRTLLEGDDRNIGDVATDWGFWHMGKFAADYRRMFGELPSQTRCVARG